MANEQTRLPQTRRTREDLLHEIQELRARIEESEETLRAIRTGEADAVVASGPEGERVFVLQGAEHPYRVFVETMTEGAVTLLADGSILFANGSFAAMIKTPVEDLLLSSIVRFLPPGQEPALQALLTSGEDRGGAGEFSLLAGDGALVPVRISVRPTEDQTTRTFCAVVTDLSQQNEAARARADLAAIVESSDDPIVGINFDGNIVTWNRGAECLYGHSAHEMAGRPFAGLLMIQDDATGEKLLARMRRGELTEKLETHYTRRDGRKIDVSVTITPVRDAVGRVTGGSMIGRDVTGYKRTECELHRLNRALRTLSHCNQILMHTESETELLDAVCRSLVEVGGYRMAWVGYALHDDAKTVQPVAHFGCNEGYLSLFPFTWAAEGHGLGPTGTAIRTGQPVVNRNTETSTVMGCRRKEALKRGYAASIALPLFLGERVLGALMLYTAEPNVFDEEEVHLLSELVEDIAFGVETVRIRDQGENIQSALRESEARFRALVTASSDVIYRMSPDWSEMRDLRGQGFLADTVEPLPDWLQKYIYPEDQPRVLEAIQAAIHSKSVFELEHRVLQVDGSLGWMHSRAVPLENERGEVIEWFGAATDITERKRAEENLRESEERFRTAFELAGAGIALVDAQGHSWRTNGVLQNMLGYSGQELAGMHFAEFTFPDDRERDWRAFCELMNGVGDRYEIETRFVRKDGEILHGLLTVSTVKDAQGLPYYAIGMVEDITARKRAEAALRESEEKFRKAFMTSGDFIYISRVSDGQVVEVNDSCVDTLGWTREEMIGKTGLELGLFANPADRAKIPAGLAEKGYIRDLELQCRKKNGEVITVLLSINLLQGFREPLMLGITRDITASKRLENQLRQAQKMEAVGRLAGGVAHDFNNLLTIIGGYGQLLLEQPGRGDPGFLQEIVKAAEKASSLTRQLLAFSRQQILAPRVLNLNSVVSDLEKMLRRLIGEHIELVTVQQPGLGQVKADSGQIDQVIINLAVNARDAMPGGGRLVIETANVTLDEAYARDHPTVVPGPHVMLAISDTGMGMDAETVSHLFEPFFTTKQKGQGTGLGLATVYGIIKQSAGSIWVYSELRRGTTFKVFLPRVDELASELDSASTAAESPTGSETILVAEDEESVRALVCTTLRAHGYQVLEAPGPLDAISIAERFTGRLHLLLTDVVMPKMSGQDLAKRFSTIQPEGKVLLMSGYTDDAVLRSGILQPGRFFLQKPFSPSALAHKVREVLDAERKDPPRVFPPT